MHALCRPILRNFAPRNVPLSFFAKPSPITRPLGLGLARNPILMRNIASSVTNQPGSQSLEHAATNVKEEIGNSTKDLAKAIAGANVTTDAVSDSSAESFVRLQVSIEFSRSIATLDWNHHLNRLPGSPAIDGAWPHGYVAHILFRLFRANWLSRGLALHQRFFNNHIRRI